MNNTLVHLAWRKHCLYLFNGKVWRHFGLIQLTFHRRHANRRWTLRSRIVLLLLSIKRGRTASLPLRSFASLYTQLHLVCRYLLTANERLVLRPKRITHCLLGPCIERRMLQGVRATSLSQLVVYQFANIVEKCVLGGINRRIAVFWLRWRLHAEVCDLFFYTFLAWVLSKGEGVVQAWNSGQGIESKA